MSDLQRQVREAEEATYVLGDLKKKAEALPGLRKQAEAEKYQKRVKNSLATRQAQLDVLLSAYNTRKKARDESVDNLLKEFKKTTREIDSLATLAQAIAVLAEQAASDKIRLSTDPIISMPGPENLRGQTLEILRERGVVLGQYQPPNQDRNTSGLLDYMAGVFRYFVLKQRQQPRPEFAVVGPSGQTFVERY